MAYKYISCALQKTLAFFALVLLHSAPALASSLMIWPIYPFIEGEQRTSALWVENKGNKAVFLQLRIYSWEQNNCTNHYNSQNSILGSPPMMEIHPGQRQLIRLIEQEKTPKNLEAAWRLRLDEIPAEDNLADNPSVGATVNIKMRYSIPLFTYGEEISQQEAKNNNGSDLRWQLKTNDGQLFLAITNQGRTHARLTNVQFDGQEKAGIISNGLLGYVLAGSEMCWPLESNVAISTLSAQVNGNASSVILPTQGNP